MQPLLQPTTTPPPLVRGERRTGRIDFATARWMRNEFGAELLSLSRDALSGAETFALRCPPRFAYAEEAHFYDCEEELFQFEGEFHHDEIAPYHAGDYVYRPIGTVYGHGEGSDAGGITIAALARERRRFHFQGHPEPWTGHYLVDRLWNPRPVQPFIANGNARPWTADALHAGVELRCLRGTPGLRSEHSGACAHSPWAADAAFMLRLPAGFRGGFPGWPGFVLELLVVSGQATVAGESWHRGCYAFDGLAGDCEVRADLEVFARAFAILA
jgi:hypothetical protein